MAPGLRSVLGPGMLLLVIQTPALAQARYHDVSATHLPRGLLDGASMDAALADLDADGDLDVVIAAEFGPDILLLNEGDGRFADASERLPRAEHDSEDVGISDFDGDAADPESSARTAVTTLLGLGHTFGGFGAQVELRVLRPDFALFGGAGYTPAIDQGDPSGLAWALGGRWYPLRSSGGRFEAYLEGAYSLVRIRGGTVDFRVDRGPVLVEGDLFFGPATLVGFRYMADSGFTVLGGIGLGVALGDVGDDSRVNRVGTLGVGYRW